MASARGLENILANSPYLPSLECLSRSRHRGSAKARISSSVLSMMFNASFCFRLVLLRDQVIAGRLLHGVFAGLRIATRDGQHVPVLVVDLHDVAAVVVARPARFPAE